YPLNRELGIFKRITNPYTQQAGIANPLRPTKQEKILKPATLARTLRRTCRLILFMFIVVKGDLQSPPAEYKDL
ncbi:MAG: hypothetical protein LUE98_05025, partial [Tannerellaceae bacterium]|nr:hypothetical protein [Tannerellaceae bacterium]